MSNPFLGQITIVGFNFAPRGYAQCNGQILSINQNQSLFALLGTTYGGDGRSTFALPDLRSRVPIHVGSSNGTSHALGNKGGEETHTLTLPRMPAHSHTVGASSSTTPNRESLSGAVWSSGSNQYTNATPDATMNTDNVSEVGGGQSHPNMQPYLVVNFCIALQGLFPSRN